MTLQPQWCVRCLRSGHQSYQCTEPLLQRLAVLVFINQALRQGRLLGHP